jgi:4-amino-4-deoxy-L-arabinose transferase-like glycosyltransferase
MFDGTKGLAYGGALRRWCSSPVRLFTFALCLRLLVAAVLLRHNPLQLFYGGNEPSHIAASLAAGQGFSAPYEHVPIAPTAQQPPLYPALLAVIFRLCGSYSFLSLWIIIVVNALAGAGTATLIYFAGQQHFSLEIGLVAAWFWAIYPWESLAEMPITNYGLSALLVTAWLVIAPKVLAKSLHQKHWILLGIGAGIAVLLNPTMGGVFLASVVWIEFTKKSAYRVCLAVAAFILVLAPWTMRNHLTLHRLVPVRDNFGLELYLGNHAGMTGDVDFTKDFPTLDPRQYSQLGEVRFMELKQHEAVTCIRNDPAGFVMRFARRVWEFWTAPGLFPWAIISFLSWLAAVLAVTSIDRRRIGRFLLITFTLVPAVYYVTHFWPTYRHPIEPLMLLAAAAATGQIRDSLRSRPRTMAVRAAVAGRVP